MPSLAEKSLIVLSGGLDSVTLCYDRVSRGEDIAGIYFDIGYKPRLAERNSARLAAHRLGLPLEVVNLPGILDMVAGFYPTESLGLGELDKGQPGPIPLAEGFRYVVGIQVLLSVAIYYAQLAGIARIYTGLIKEQYDLNRGLGDFSDRFVDAVQPLNPNIPIAMENPFRGMSKAEVVRLGTGLGVPFVDTWSCLDGQPRHCGQCAGCVSRKGGFEQASVADPTTYLS